MKPYEKYKDSGIEWIGEIPEEWKLNRLKYICLITTGNKDTIDKVNNGAFPFFVRSKFVESINSYSYDGEAILTAGDGDICKIWHYVNGKFDFHQRVYMLYDFQGVIGKFLYYYISENFYHDVFKLSAKNTVDSLRLPMFQNFLVCIPPLSEQKQIARYLDHQCGIIDELIAKKQRLIELLKEKRQSVINEAVTRGLNPHAPLKPSGIDWLGDIPEGWEVISLRHLITKAGSGITPRGGAEVYSDHGVIFIRSQNVHFDGLRFDDAVRISPEIHGQMQNSKVMKNDVLLNITGASIGRCCVADIEEEMNVNQHVCVIRPNQRVESAYLKLLLESFIGQHQIRLGSYGGNREGLTLDELKSFQMPLPNFTQQEEIMHFLTRKTNEIQSTQTAIETQIEKLKEYRQSIISEAVTGKVDVRDWKTE